MAETYIKNSKVFIYVVTLILFVSFKAYTQDKGKLDPRMICKEYQQSEALSKEQPHNHKVDLLLETSMEKKESDCYKEQLLTFFLSKWRKDSAVARYNSILDLFINKLYESNFYVLNWTPVQRKENVCPQFGCLPFLINTTNGLYNIEKNKVYIDFDGISDERQLIYVAGHELFHSIDVVIRGLYDSQKYIEKREQTDPVEYKKRLPHILKNVDILVRGGYINNATIESWITLPIVKKRTVTFSEQTQEAFRNYIQEIWVPKKIVGIKKDTVLSADELHDALSYIQMICLHLIYDYVGELRALQIAKLNADYFFTSSTVEPSFKEKRVLQFYADDGPKLRVGGYKSMLRLIKEYKHEEDKLLVSYSSQLWEAILEEVVFNVLEDYIDSKETENCPDENCYFFHLFFME